MDALKRKMQEDHEYVGKRTPTALIRVLRRKGRHKLKQDLRLKGE